MRLVYARHAEGNFGDDLNTLLWPQIFPFVSEEEVATTGFVGIGTIIGMPAVGMDRLHVFSSGVGYDSLAEWRGKEVHYWCVRGRISAALLSLPRDAAITDGAYLCPLTPGFPELDPTGAGGVVVIPHVDSMQFAGWDLACAQLGFTLLDPRGAALQVIEKIARAKLVLTESLHGAILADAYGVPWTPFGSSRNFAAMKWADWLSGLEIKPFISSIAPPSIHMVARHGRHRDGLGDQVDGFLADHASAAPTGRAQPSIKTKTVNQMKQVFAHMPGAGFVSGYTPQRTAEALARLAQSPPVLSCRDTVAALQARLLAKAREFAREAGSGATIAL